MGVGAIAGAALLPAVRQRLSPGAALGVGSLVVAGLALVMAFVHVSVVVGVALAVGGTAWIVALSTLNSLYQTSLPGWVKTRGMGFYLVVFQGGNAIGSAVMGIVAQRAGLSASLVVVAGGLRARRGHRHRFPFKVLAPADLLPAGDWPSPHIVGAIPAGGPVMVSVEYRSLPEQHDALLDALRSASYSRRRTGASSWQVWRDGADPQRILGQFVVASSEEHERQHARVSVRDQARYARIDAMTDPRHPPDVTHWLVATDSA